MISNLKTTTACPSVATCNVPEMICTPRTRTDRSDCRSTASPVEILPPHPGPLPSALRMQSMSTPFRAQALISRLVKCLLVIEGLRAGFFLATPDTCPEKRMRNARRRCRRLIDRGRQFELRKNGRWQLGKSSALMQ